LDKFIGLGQTQVRDPNAHPTDPRGNVQGWSNGLTKREYFAAMVLQGLCSLHTDSTHDFPERAVVMADALIAELGKK
jgi:hypothetical protein